MEYAIFQTGGKQYKASVGDILEIEKLPVEKNKSASFEEILLWRSNDHIKLGTPFIPNAKVSARVLDHVKGDKIRVTKYKAKVRYRRVQGHRQLLTRVQVETIEMKNIKENGAQKSKSKNMHKT